MVRVGDGKKSIGVSKVGKWLSLVGGIEVGGKLRGLRFLSWNYRGEYWFY